ncbi:hypothetical protein [Brevundimonas sp. NIBR11]|uniref:hypothetical protein n=1 Tax=Brevundimonas sp. NIBR11 TaxID=3015999 RepID=UPI0022F10A80|nr:hypothetical protein [Brevundimonas sp. NIBR11]WGM32272.1 hypothetical protein KKHFBJBL_02523 [Brevundimonas sp. NIBR11]
MSSEGLGVLITPSAAGTGWREALTARAVSLGWAVHDGASEPPGVGLVFAHDHAGLLAFPPSARAVVRDTTATANLDPGQPAVLDEIILRSTILAEAELAATQGAAVFNAARYVLDFPILGTIERRDDGPYRIHPSVSESPLAIFDDLEPGSQANWHPRWFVYVGGYEGSIDEPQIDMTGRMRAFLHGPYIRLPAGRWRVDVHFTVDPQRAHAPLLFEWGSGIEFSRIMTEINYPGSYAVSLDRVWQEADAAQLRIWNAHPVFQGRFGFQGARVTRVAMDDPTPPTPTDRIVEASVG